MAKDGFLLLFVEGWMIMRESEGLPSNAVAGCIAVEPLWTELHSMKGEFLPVSQVQSKIYNIIGRDNSGCYIQLGT